jgi:type VI secretion system protein ImpA
VNVDEFLAKIPGGDDDPPAGGPVPFAVKAELEEARKEIDPDDYAPDDPARPTEAKTADWPAIARLAEQTLKETSKDLLVAARLTEALTRLRGFDGLADGLAVMRGMVGQCWDRMYPEIEDGDLEVRAGPFYWLGDADRGARFPHTVRNTPLFTHDGVPVGWRQWKDSQDGKGKVGREDLERAISGVPREACKAAFEAVTRVVTELNGVAEVLNQKLGRESPGMTDLRSAVGECFSLAKQILDKKGPEPTEEEAGESAAGVSAEGGGSASTGRAMLSRADVYRRLGEAADLLERLEPHSPIPYLIRKAVELGAMPFPLLMRALVRDDSVLSQMNRELGIKEP